MQRLALLLNRKVAAANVFGIPLYVLEQQGFRKVVDTTFMIGFLVSMEAQERGRTPLLQGFATSATRH